MYKIAKFTIALLLIFFVSQNIFADTFYVSKTGGHISPFSSLANAATNIQAAVDVATSGDTVLVNDGTYYPNSQIFVPENITVKSINGKENTIVNGSSHSRCFYTKGVIDGFTITNGFANLGGGVNCEHTSSIVKNCIISGNSAYEIGGGIYSRSGTIENCIITGNSATQTSTVCGGIYCYDNTTIQNCTISKNSGYFVGGISGKFNIQNCTVSRNSAYANCGGISCSEGTIQNCIINENWAGNDIGGVACGENTMVENCIISGNLANSDEGGIACFGGIVQNCIISNNSATSHGGVYCSENAIIQNCLIRDNSDYGVYLAGNSTVQNCTISGNSGGGLYHRGDGMVQNCILWNNTNHNYSSSFMSDGTNRYNCIQNWTTLDNGIITNNPQFISAENFRLQSASPCINSGTNLQYVFITYDLDGNPRTMGTKVDMGAFEYIIGAQPNGTIEIISDVSGIGTSANPYDLNTTIQGNNDIGSLRLLISEANANNISITRTSGSSNFTISNLTSAIVKDNYDDFYINYSANGTPYNSEQATFTITANLMDNIVFHVKATTVLLPTGQLSTISGVIIDNGSSYDLGKTNQGDNNIASFRLTINDGNANNVSITRISGSSNFIASGLASTIPKNSFDDFSIIYMANGQICIPEEAIFNISANNMEDILFHIIAVTYPAKISNEWTRIWGSPDAEFGYSVCVDNEGFIYVAGKTSGSFDGQVNGSKYELCLSKYNNTGLRLWTSFLGAAHQSANCGVFADNNGYIYVGSGVSDFCLIKCNNNGIKQWERIRGSSTWDAGKDISIDNSGNIYIAGYTYGSFDGQSNNGYPDLCLIKYNSDGVKLWTRIWGTSEADLGNGTSVDNNGNVYVVGTTYASFDGQNYNGNGDICLSKYNSGGSRLWSRICGSASNDHGVSIVNDSVGNIYVAGETLGAFDGQNNIGLDDLCLIKYNSSGEKQWTRIWGTISKDYASGVSVDNAGNIYVAGSSCSSFCLIKYNSVGEKQWLNIWGSGYGKDVVVDNSGNLYFAGYTWGEFDGQTNCGSADLCLIKFNKQTNIQPNKPSNQSPVNGAIEISLTPVLQSSSFSDSNSGDTHLASQWRIANNSSFSSVVYDSGETTASKTSLTVPSGKLEEAMIYYWHVKHKNNNENWSDYSDETSFETLPEPFGFLIFNFIFLICYYIKMN